MDFGLSEEQELLQETLRGFIANECPPPRLREIFEAGAGHDAALWSGLAEMGVTGLIVPERYGGAGMELLDLALVAETMGEGALPGPFEGHALVCLALAHGGSREQCERWLPKLASGERIGALACCESGGQWYPESWTPKRQGDRVHGCKLFVPHAEVADLLLIGAAGGELLLVECADPGVRTQNLDGIDRTRPIFRVDLDNALCEPLQAGAELAERICDAGLVITAADSFGTASRLIDQCVAFAGTREQFGRKIGEFQAVKHQIARLGTEIEPTRALYWYAAYAWDHLPAESSRRAALAKAHISDRAMETARMAVELHGGIGFTWECDVQMWFKRAMFNRALLGTPEWLRERCASLAGW